MEPIKQKWRYHALLIFIIIALDLYGDYVYLNKPGFVSNFLYPGFLYVCSMYFSFFSIYYINFRWLSPFTLVKKRYFGYVIGAIGLAFLFAGIRYLLEEVVIFSMTGNHNYADQTRVFGYYVFDNTYYSIKAILFSTTLFLLFRFIENKAKLFELQLETKKTELRFLKSQLEPHFLFNTLNSFYSELIESQPETAKDIHKLSELLRFVTYDSQEDFVSLEKDLKFIESYIYFHKKRFETNFFIDYTFTGTVANQKIPAMVLIHFVENVFKHGIIHDASAVAKINIRIDQDSMTIYTKNKINTSENYTQNGIGYTSLKRRLDVLFEGEYILKNKQEDSYFEASLQIPL
ncbi:sensor histidine kinase [Dokdonia ponticola]|uniref:Sensor histidine kinase n=1 Tax=Dokdonia ponticola TaxID=2041041 RepID=A0ABV9I300_9FLAO